MRNIQSVVKTSFSFLVVISLIICCSGCSCVCFCVCRPVTAVFVDVWTQHPEADQRCDRGAAEGPWHPQQSGEMESSFLLLVTESLSFWLADCVPRSQIWWPKYKRSALRFREATPRCTPSNLCSPTVTHTQTHAMTQHSPKCEHECWLTSHEAFSSACVNRSSCIMSSVVWCLTNNPDDVIRIISDWPWDFTTKACFTNKTTSTQLPSTPAF